MNDQLWWERWPEVRDRELAALNSAGIIWELDEKAVSKGIYRLALTLPPELGGHQLSVVYPDAYPYFRCQIYAEHLALPYHQNPFDRNLCLLGRRTHFWDVNDTAARLIIEQFPNVLMAAATVDREKVIGVEEPQAEPFSEYYSYAFSMVLVQSDWVIPRGVPAGHFVVGLPPNNSGSLPIRFIRGAALRLQSETGDVICDADESIRTTFCGRQFEGRWARTAEPIKEANAFHFVQKLVKLHPKLQDANANHVEDGWLRIWGVLFPEEIGHRNLGEGWVFVCLVDKNRPQEARRPNFNQGTKKSKKQGR